MGRRKTKVDASPRDDEQTLGVDCPEDTEGWMAERPNYWLDLPDPPPPTRASWLRHRIAEAAAYFGIASPVEAPAPVSEEEWIRLSEMALGPLPRPEPEKPSPKREARPASPDARQPARKPEAYSQEPGPRAPVTR